MRRMLLLAALAACLQSCLIVPMVPHYRDSVPSRENIDRALKEGFPEVGRTTREEVLRRLGAPDLRSADGSRILYRWRKITAEVGFMNSSSPVISRYSLEILFDDAGVVGDAQSR